MPCVRDGWRRHGWLRAGAGGRLTGEDGAPVQLRGMSSHGLAWFPQYTGLESLRTLRAYGASAFRAAMYVDADPGNYHHSPADREKSWAALRRAVDNALSLGLYAVADWHILGEGNPLARADSAADFFGRLSRRYAACPGLLYEICNEPNGADWADIAAYAARIIPIIRENAPRAPIIVGTPRFCGDLDAPRDAPLPYDNLLYSYHYYTGHTGGGYRRVLDAALGAGLPVFISEWGIGRDGDAKDACAQHAPGFMAYAREHGLSWLNWSLCNKAESFSAIRPEVDTLGGWQQADLTESGQLVFAGLRA